MRWSLWILAGLVLAALARKALQALRDEDYVYVQNDGSYRELTLDEREYVRTEFLPGDGARPYIKGRYRSRTPTGSLAGFLLRRKLPKEVRREPRQA